ncbi:MAG: hypothetical protein AAB731_03940, partial [Patescibacteria group bacterium]
MSPEVGSPKVSAQGGSASGGKKIKRCGMADNADEIRVIHWESELSKYQILRQRRMRLGSKNLKITISKFF